MKTNLKFELDETVEGSLKYTTLICALQYISNGTSPDIAYEWNHLSRFKTVKIQNTLNLRCVF